jgi:murein DD-endopeptidase MepM/ murein hydrolase activator NlpD
MSEAVDALTQKVNTLNAAVSSTATTAQSAFGSVLNGVAAQGGQLQLGSTNTNMMSGSLAPFSTQTPTPTSMGGSAGGGTAGMSGAGAPPPPPPSGPAAGAAGGGGNRMTGALAKVGGIDPSTMAQGAGIMQGVIGVAQMALAPVAGAYAAAMPTGQIVDSATSYYQAALRAPGISRSALESSTLAAMSGGITSVGSPAIVSNILANSGFMPGTSQYTQAAQQTALAAQNYGMDNATAANSITSFSNMSIANNLFNQGISTLDANGNALSPGDITKQLMARFYPNGGNPTQLNRSIQYGSFQNQLAGFGITDPNTQQLITGNAMTIASGGNPNAVQNNAGNANPLNSIFTMNQSQTGILQGSEANALSGLQTAAQYVKAFNDTMGPIIESMARYRAILEGGLSTNAGQGVKAGVSTFFSGVKNVIGGVAQFFMGKAAGGGGTPGYGASIAGPKGGGTPGFGGLFGGPKGGGTPSLNGMSSTANPMISAPYGATDSSGIWSSTSDQHQGVDFAVPSGTPVRATKDGIVSGKVLSADYGQAILLEHKDGWSSIYAHLSNKEVSIGSQVLAGDEIGKSGVSGNTTGPSLHYEVWKGDNNPVDPASLPGAFSSPISSGSLADVSSTAGPKAVNPNAGTAGDQQFAKALLDKAGIKPTDTNITALTTWMHWEGGTKNNAFNPLNTTYDIPGAGNFNKEGVKTYGSLQQGVDATYGTLTGQSADKRGYTAILNDLKNSASLDQVVSDINHSSWGTHIKGGGTPGAGTTISGGSSGGGTINNVSINLSIAHASDSEAHLFAKKVKEILANDHNVLAIGSS